MTGARFPGSRSARPGSPDTFVLEPQQLAYALSSKLFEYVVLGVPVVCSDLPTLKEHFADDELMFFEAGNAEALAGALRSVSLDGAAAAGRAAEALKRYRRDYAWTAQSERYRDVLAHLTR